MGKEREEEFKNRDKGRDQGRRDYISRKGRRDRGREGGNGIKKKIRDSDKMEIIK